ncbi:hypothetical protein PENSPDRAFT_687078 [Peniophora sp. CONT]|nr:hypothetical protein PENSPDRAFT_687078 [Peniophora sp. CONT]
MSVSKIPLLLAAWASYVIAYTSPNPPAPAKAQTSYQTQSLSIGARFVQKYTSKATVAQRMFVSSVMLLEIAFAADIPSLRRTLPNAAASTKQLSFVSPLFLLGVACAVCGALVRLWSYRAMGAQFTFQLSLLKDHKLITTGPYAYVRHPSYTALIMTVVGIFLCELSSGSWYMEARAFDSPLGKVIALLAGCCVAILVSVVSRVAKEDQLLSENFGQEWKEWENRVPYRLVPGIL